MKKKSLGLILSVAAVMVLAACGQVDNAPVETPTQTAVETAAESGMTGAIKVFTRDATSGTREAFEGIVGFADKLTNDAFEVSSNGDMSSKIGSEKSGIGYVSLTTDFEANKLIPVSYEGVEPNIATVIDGTYKLSRPFSYTTRAKGDFESTEKEELVAAFIDYLVNSVEGREVVLGSGGIVNVDEGTPWDELKKNHPIVDKDNSGITISTAGSTSVEKTLKAAIESFIPLAGNFKINMNQTGSGDGFKRVLGTEKDGANKADIGFASRNFKSEEDVSGALVSGEYCKDAVVVVVNAENTGVKNLTQAQVASIFEGVTKNWEDIK